MSDLADTDYYAARARQEREWSEAATDRGAVVAHAELALRYEFLAAQFGTRTEARRVDARERQSA